MIVATFTEGVNTTEFCVFTASVAAVLIALVWRGWRP